MARRIELSFQRGIMRRSFAKITFHSLYPLWVIHLLLWIACSRLHPTMLFASLYGSVKEHISKAQSAYTLSPATCHHPDQFYRWCFQPIFIMSLMDNIIGFHEEVISLFFGIFDCWCNFSVQEYIFVSVCDIPWNPAQVNRVCLG